MSFSHLTGKSLSSESVPSFTLPSDSHCDKFLLSWCCLSSIFVLSVLPRLLRPNVVYLSSTRRVIPHDLLPVSCLTPPAIRLTT
eukprot:767191-Hanusia_phi.AAC.6